MAVPNLLDPQILNQNGTVTPPIPDFTPVSPTDTIQPPAAFAPPQSPMSGGVDIRPAPRNGPGQHTFADVLQHAIPFIVAALAGKQGGALGAGALLQGYSKQLQEQRLIQEKQHEFDATLAQNTADDVERRRIADEARQGRITTFIQGIAGDLAKFDDPAQYAAFLNVADDTAMKAFGTPKGWLSSQLSGTFDKTKATAKAQQLAKDRVELLQKRYGSDFESMVEQGATTPDPTTGQDIPIKTLLAHAGMGATMPGGQIATPAIAETESTYIARAVRSAQKAAGRALTEDETNAAALKARKDYQEAGQKGSNVGSFEDYIIRKYGTNPTAQQIEAGHLAYNQNSNPEDRLTPAGIEYAAAKERITGKMIALGYGQAAQSDRRAIINKVAEQNQALGRTPAASLQRQAGFKADAGALNRMTNLKSSAESFETKALAQTGLIDRLSDAVPRTQWPIINGALLSGKAAFGNSQTTQLYNAITTFSAEYAKIMEGSTGSAAAVTEGARAAAERLISAKLNKGTMKDVLGLMQWEMRQSIIGYDATIDHINERLSESRDQPQGPPPQGPPAFTPPPARATGPGPGAAGQVPPPATSAFPANGTRRAMPDGTIWESDGKEFKPVPPIARGIR